MSRCVVSVVLVLLLPVLAGGQTPREVEDFFWREAACEKAGEMRAYLAAYPRGVYVEAARRCLEDSLGLSRADRILVQQGLASLDYAPGPADGLFGGATRAAVRQWQRAKGEPVTGYLTRVQAEALTAAGRAAVAAAQAEADRQRREQEAAARAEADRQRKAEEAWPREWTNSLGMEFVLIEPGTFEMGSPFGETGRDADETRHTVTLSQPYYLGKYEVTQGEWQAVMGDNPSYFFDCRRCPVENVSWEDVQSFIEVLNYLEEGTSYRLPTEAEWEYAARGGTQGAYHFGEAANRLGQYAWYSENSGGRTHPVGQKRPNQFGLYDMHGNVLEWTADWYDAYPRGAVTDPRGPSSGASRVFRGGCWYFYARYCRSAFRRSATPGDRYSILGFRLARTP